MCLVLVVLTVSAIAVTGTLAPMLGVRCMDVTKENAGRNAVRHGLILLVMQNGAILRRGQVKIMATSFAKQLILVNVNGSAQALAR